MPKKSTYFNNDSPKTDGAGASAGEVVGQATLEIERKKQLLRRLEQQQKSNYAQMSAALMMLDDDNELEVGSPAGFLLTPAHDITTPPDAPNKPILRERVDNSKPVTEMQRLQRDIANTSSSIDKLVTQIEQAEADMSSKLTNPTANFERVS